MVRADVLVIEHDMILRGLMAHRGEAPGLIVSDRFMLNACGVAAISKLKRRDPENPLIAVSGYFIPRRGGWAESGRSAGAARTLSTPIPRADLLRADAGFIGPPGP
jgi:CheY-like chemotaxis protein